MIMLTAKASMVELLDEVKIVCLCISAEGIPLRLNALRRPTLVCDRHAKIRVSTWPTFMDHNHFLLIPAGEHLFEIGAECLKHVCNFPLADCRRA